MISLLELSRYTGLVSFVVGMPTTLGTYYQVIKTRREAREARQGLVYSENCLEFVTEAGVFVNLVPLETLHSLPKPGEIVLLPGSPAEAAPNKDFAYAAYRVSRVEHIYADMARDPRFSRKKREDLLPGQARLAKAVAHVELLSGPDRVASGISKRFV